MRQRINKAGVDCQIRVEIVSKLDAIRFSYKAKKSTVYYVHTVVKNLDYVFTEYGKR